MPSIDPLARQIGIAAVFVVRLPDMFERIRGQPQLGAGPQRLALDAPTDRKAASVSSRQPHGKPDEREQDYQQQHVHRYALQV
jgi:hypothetical protein